MLGFYIALPFLIFALYRLFVVLYNYFSRPYLPIGIPEENPLVSILVYAQNSEKSIGTLIKGLLDQTHQNFEVLIYNDLSNDKTVDIIAEVSAGDKRFRLFNGNDINIDWQRKNYAYYKLAQLAKGQYYIFLNSDSCVDNQFVANALAHVQRKSLSLLTIYPKPQSSQFWLGMRISVFQWIFLSAFYAKSLIKKEVEKKFFIGKPLIIIEANTYQTNGWQEKFKDKESPETQIAKSINSLNLKSDSLLGDNSITYEVENFDSEIYLTSLTKSRNGLIAYTTANALGLILAILLLPFPLVFLYLFAIIYGRMLVAMLCQQSVLVSLLLLPVQYFVMIKILFKAIKKGSKD